MLPSGWKSLQDTSSDAKAGSCVAYRTDVASCSRSWLVKGCDAPPDGGMLPRWLACAELVDDSGETIPVMSAHAPPPRYSSLQPGFNANVAKVANSYPGMIVGTDANKDLAAFARELGKGYVAYGKGGIGLVSTRTLVDVDVDSWGTSQGATDHPCVSGSVEDD